jgi:hypothetical protein
MLASTRLTVISALILGLVACGSSDSEGPQTGDDQNVTAAKKKTTAPFSGKFALAKNQSDEFLVSWFVSLDMAPDGSFTGEMNGNVADDDGNVETGTTGPIKGNATFTNVDGSEGVMAVVFKQDGGRRGSDVFKFKMTASSVELVHEASLLTAGIKSWKTTPFADLVKKAGNGGVFKIEK